MVDPTELGKSEQKRRKEEKNRRFGVSFLFGLLGGVLGGAPFIALYLAVNLISWPFMILSGLGVYVMYLYFIDVNERNKKQLPFLILSVIASVVVVLFVFILINLHKTGSGITARNIIDTYFNNGYSVGSVFDYTLFWHLFALLFSLIGFFAVWLYVRIAVPRWEKKHGKTEAGTTGFSSRKQNERTGKTDRKRISGMK
jgi:signal transduction histidine kinase